jgi:LmbE family N-acetylglucosaminyl deacetylase
VAARDPLFFPEHGLSHHRPRTLLLWEADAPDHAEDVTDFVDTKLAALEAHTSQYRSTMRADDADEMEAFRRRIRQRLAELGRGLDVAAAEVFARLDDL